jgi:hypothetical protein
MLASENIGGKLAAMGDPQDHDSQPVCSTTIGFPCVDGPLVGEFHQRGEWFEFEGLRIRLGGAYRLVGWRYVWQAGAKATRYT